MVIIGINSSHVATACLLKDGKILACVSEERLSRIKHQAGLPILAIRECLKISGVKLEEIDYLALNYKDPKTHMGVSAYAGEKGIILDSSVLSLKQRIFSLSWRLKEILLINFPYTKYLFDKLLDIFYKIMVDPKVDKDLLLEIESKIGIPGFKVLKAEHHSAHAYSAYYGYEQAKDKPLLIFTLDSLGDGICATVSIAKNGQLERIATTPSGGSIGDLYTQTTAYLGMKLGEHEYKVMGLAPYAYKKHYIPLLEKLRSWVWVNDDLTMETKIHSHMFYKVLPKLYAYQRFDNVAAAVQGLTEEVICKWVKMAIAKTGIQDIVCAGGVFMNVKANQKILEIKEVKSLYIVPSASDESTAIGAAYWCYKQQMDKADKQAIIEPIRDMYLGGEFSRQQIEDVLKDKRYSNIRVSCPKDIEKSVAKILSLGNIVARFSSRMEFGARALGNRSILAHPQKLELLEEINNQIKSRDFWMPFAPSILDEDKDKFFLNHKNMKAPYMIITFDSTKEGQEKLRAALHQYDHTLRPQIVYKNWNPSYYKLIEEFKKLTDIGAVLNTSFNLHGYPIVYTPEDALFVFQESGLKFLALGPFLLSKE